MTTLPENKKIIIFDGVCNLCNRYIQFIIKRDKKDIFRFVSLQSELGTEIIQYIGLDITKTDSIVLYEPGKAYYIKSEAILKIADDLGGIFTALKTLLIFPPSILNTIYSYVAKNRYKWYGKTDLCMAPTPELKAKFL
jgi:predicted DCC family thiol-disulfide oxidoreductase YuxK